MKVYGRSRMKPGEKQRIANTLPEGGLYLEIGSLTGASVSQIIDQRLDIKATCIDALTPGTGNGQLSLEDDYIHLFRNYNYRRKNMQLFIGTAQEFYELTGGHLKYDVILVDADHAYEAVCKDLRTARKLIRPDGIIVVHDYTTERGKALGIAKAADEFCSQYGWEISAQLEMSAFLRRIQ